VGYASQPSHGNPPPPAGADPQLWSWFVAVDTDRSGAISAPELQRALLNGDWTHFDLDTVKLLMSIFDVDRSGTISFNEFAGLWKYVKDWQQVFRHFDADGSGSIDKKELSNALKTFGFQLSSPLLTLLEKKYDLLTSHAAGLASLPTGEARYELSPGITFDRFVRACVVVKQLTESFQRLDADRDGWVSLNYEMFMQMYLEAP